MSDMLRDSDCCCNTQRDVVGYFRADSAQETSSSKQGLKRILHLISVFNSHTKFPLINFDDLSEKRTELSSVETNVVIYMQSNKIHQVFLISEFYSALMLARHVSDLTGPSSGAFCTSCIRRLRYVVLRVQLDTNYHIPKSANTACTKRS